MICDGCGKERKPYKTETVYLGDGSIDDIFYFCFLCVKEGEREEEKALRNTPPEFIYDPNDDLIDGGYEVGYW